MNKLPRREVSPHALNAPPIAAVIFDCDGTLVDSEELGGLAMYEVALRYGASITQHAFLQSYTGRTMAENIALINAHSPTLMPESFAAEVRSLMARKFDEALVEIEGAGQLLAQLAKRAVPMAVATNGPRAKAEQTLRLTGLRAYFGAQGSQDDRLFCAYEHGTFKPAPDLFWRAAQALGVPYEACAVVEDSASGLLAGTAAGMQVFSLVELALVSTPSPIDPPPLVLPNLLALLDYLP